MKLRGKVVAVTGGGNGLGRELVLGLLARGARVAAIDRDPARLDETATLAGAGERLSLHVADITDRARVAALPDEVVAAHGAVDGVINCAGIIQPFVKLKDLDDAAIDRVMAVNFHGTLWMIRSFLPLLLERPEAHLVDVASMGGFLPVPGQTIYGASKAAVMLMTEGLYAELLETRVKVSVVLPGAIGTKIAENSGVKLDLPAGAESSMPTLPPERAAAILLDGVERDRPRILVGRDAKLMDLLHRLAPTFATRLVARQMRSLLSS